jgi:hypothetical protein
MRPAPGRCIWGRPIGASAWASPARRRERATGQRSTGNFYDMSNIDHRPEDACDMIGTCPLLHANRKIGPAPRNPRTYLRQAWAGRGSLMAKQRIAGGSLFRLCGSSSRWGRCSTSVTHEKTASVGTALCRGPGEPRWCGFGRRAREVRRIGTPERTESPALLATCTLLSCAVITRPPGLELALP